MNSSWRKVTKADPCPICGKDHACKVSRDGAVAMCKRVEQGAFKESKGWYFHGLIERPKAGHPGNGQAHPPSTRAQQKAKAPKAYSDIQAAIDAAGRQCGGSFVAGWTYHNQDGSEVLRVTTGSPWPDGSPRPKGSVILICAEDDPGDTIKPRLEALGADCRRVHLLSVVRRIAADGKRHDVLFTLADVAALETALKQHPDCRLIVVDPIGSFLGGNTDAHRDNEARSVLAPVAKMAERYGPAVLVVAHRRKGGGSSADDLALGSRAFTGIARAVWHLSRDNENKARRLLLPGKNNLAPEGDGLAFTIQGDPPSLVWEREPVAMSADDALAQENGNGNDEHKPGPEPEARSQAVEWLRDLLRGGTMESAKIKTEAESAGYAWRTVHRAKDVLTIKPYREQFGGAWMWKLPADPACKDLPCHAPDNGENLASWHDRENPTKNGAIDVPKSLPCQDNQSGTMGADTPPAGDGWQRGRI